MSGLSYERRRRERACFVFEDITGILNAFIVIVNLSIALHVLEKGDTYTCFVAQLLYIDILVHVCMKVERSKHTTETMFENID